MTDIHEAFVLGIAIVGIVFLSVAFVPLILYDGSGDITQINEKYTAFCNFHGLFYDSDSHSEECYYWQNNFTKKTFQFNCDYQRDQIGFILPLTAVKVKNCYFVEKGNNCYFRDLVVECD